MLAFCQYRSHRRWVPVDCARHHTHDAGPNPDPPPPCAGAASRRPGYAPRCLRGCRQECRRPSSCDHTTLLVVGKSAAATCGRSLVSRECPTGQFADGCPCGAWAARHGAVRVRSALHRGERPGSERVRPSVGPGEPEDLLRDVGKDQIGRDGGDLVEPRFPKLALHVVVRCEAEAAVRLQAGVGRLP